MRSLSRPRTNLTIALAVAVALSAAGLLAIGRPVAAATHEIAITDSAFATPELTVQVGDTVTWNNVDDRPHTVTSEDGTFDSGNVNEGATFSFTFTEPGTYRYICLYHPDMVGTIVVAAPAAATATAEPVTAPAPSDASAATPHASGHASGAADHQPDTALPSSRRIPALSWLLWGMGLVTVGIALAPWGRRAAAVAARPPGGWRR